MGEYVRISKVPADLDWVTARAKCSSELLFQNLRSQLERDVDSVNALDRRRLSFDLSFPNDNKLVVTRNRDIGGFNEAINVIFELEHGDGAITIRRRASQMNDLLARGRPELSPEGECLIKVEGQTELVEAWQFSRLGLEDLFFGFAA